jgi:hypothetical protein
MIKKIEDLNFYELLEVGPSATAQDIHKAYERVRRVYEPNSIALYSLFTPEEIAVIHQRIEEAYRTLVYEDNRKRYDALLRGQEELPEPPPPLRPESRFQAPTVQAALSLHSVNRHTGGADGAANVPPVQHTPSPYHPPAEATAPAPPFSGEFTGPSIKLMREQRGWSIRYVADTTKVGSRYLEYIEGENYAKLPARPYLRGFLGLYAKALGYEPERMISDYLKRFDAAVNPPKK